MLGILQIISDPAYHDYLRILEGSQNGFVYISISIQRTDRHRGPQVAGTMPTSIAQRVSERQVYEWQAIWLQSVILQGITGLGVLVFRMPTVIIVLPRFASDFTYMFSMRSS